MTELTLIARTSVFSTAFFVTRANRKRLATGVTGRLRAVAAQIRATLLTINGIVVFMMRTSYVCPA